MPRQVVDRKSKLFRRSSEIWNLKSVLTFAEEAREEVKASKNCHSEISRTQPTVIHQSSTGSDPKGCSNAPDTLGSNGIRCHLDCGQRERLTTGPAAR